MKTLRSVIATSPLLAAVLVAPALMVGTTTATTVEAETMPLPQTACVAEATETVSEAWVCLDDSLSYNAGTKGAPDWREKTVPGRPAEAGKVALTPTAGGSANDTWCEPSGRCARLLSDYIAKVKGNAIFGVGGNVYGEIDVVWRQAFDGPWARWRLNLIWESGKAVDSDRWVAWQREENTAWVDGSFCAADPFEPAVVSRYNFSAWDPGTTTYRRCAKKIDKTETWHDDLYGWFYSGGELFRAGTLHTGHWRSWKKADGTYGVKYTSAWDY